MDYQIPDYLSDDQRIALLQILKSTESETVSTLTGVAGSGKSTLTGELLALTNRSAVLGAPTGKAALVLKEKTGQEASTIHRLLYGRAFYNERTRRLTFGNPKPPCQPDELLIIDEASMISADLYKDLMSQMPRTASALFIGDKEQLPPVFGSWGPDLDNATANLTTVHRQAEKSQIIRYASAIRLGRGDQWQEKEYDDSDPDLQVYTGLDSAVEFLVDARLHNEDATLLTYTHEVRQEVNRRVREQLGLYDPKHPIVPGDKLVVRSNNHEVGLMNGEVVTVKTTFYDPAEEIYYLDLEELSGIPMRVRVEHIEVPAHIFQMWKKQMPRDETGLYLHVHYGQCLTVHSSQGSSWKKVGFIWDRQFRRLRRQDPATGRRFLYTAVTRASESLSLFLLE